MRSIAQEGSGRQDGDVPQKCSKKESSFSSPSLKKQYFNVPGWGKLKSKSSYKLKTVTTQLA